jgi:3-isopropylmalate dehydrogenase
MSGLKPEIARQIDLLIVRELNGDVYFGDKGTRTREDGQREGWDMMSYAEGEVRRIAHTAFRAAQGRNKRLCSVDKANVLETSQLWRDVMIEVAAEYPDVALDHMYVDNAAMQLVRNPGQFDVVVTGNLFGDILSDQASMCVGSIGLLASASLGERQTEFGTFGMYEPIHGTAPDIAGQGKANPMAMILSAAMMLRHSFGREDDAARIEAAVAKALADGVLGGDLGGNASTQEIGDAVLDRL